MPEGAGATSLAVLANDDDPDGDPLTIIVRTNGAHGTVTITGDGTGLTYDPVSLYHGTDTFSYTISDGQGGTDKATVVVTVTKDATDPVVAVPTERLLGGTVATTSLKTRLAWSASDPGSGIKSYQLQVSVNGRTFATLALPSPTRTYLDQVLSDGVRYRYRVRATDREGNVSAWRYTATFKAARFQESTALATWTGAWANYKTTRALGGAVRYASTLGRAVSFRYTVYDRRAGHDQDGVEWLGRHLRRWRLHLAGQPAGLVHDVPPTRLRSPLPDPRRAHHRGSAHRLRPGGHRCLRGPAVTLRRGPDRASRRQPAARSAATLRRPRQVAHEQSGRGLAYVRLFSEIGLSLLITTLAGVFVGYWVDRRLGDAPGLRPDRLLHRGRGRDLDHLPACEPVPGDDRVDGRGRSDRRASAASTPRSRVWSDLVERHRRRDRTDA